MIWEIVTSNILTALWAVFKGGILGIILALVIYKIVARSTGWNLGAARYWVLALWIVTLPLGCGAVWVLFAAQSAANDVIESEAGTTSRILGERVGNPILVIGLGVTGASAGAGLRGTGEMRVPMTALFAARQEIANQLETIHSNILLEIEAKDKGFARSFRVWIVRHAYDALFVGQAAQRLALVDDFLSALDSNKSSDGTVGTGEISEVIGNKYLRPQIQSLTKSLFGGVRLYVYLILFGLIVVPLLICRLLRSSRGRRTPTPEPIP